MMINQPQIDVGIFSGTKLQFTLECDFHSKKNKVFPAGHYTAVINNRQISVISGSGEKTVDSSFWLAPLKTGSFFELQDVIIGVGFHWEQKENQRFEGELKLISEGEKIRVINYIHLEEYLKSVISSEMSDLSSMELLKAHAVISRSWLLAQVEKKKKVIEGSSKSQTLVESDEEIVRWYDREDHQNFDVCADDHCQRYQGITKFHSGKAMFAVNETYAEVLENKGEICDTRFSKCCGGITENFENVWEPVRHSYLTKIVDLEFGGTTCVDLRQEEEAALWIRNKPRAFCNTTDQKILSQVLPDFDQATTDFFRWKVKYRQDELSHLLKVRSGIDFGNIIQIEPLQRGHSGRLIKLKIHGTRKVLVVGKELEIRKWLSDSHLYSSAFVIDHLQHKNGIPQEIILSGAGWGHGVGLCQVGAAVMGEKGYSYKEILNHYFRGIELKKIYP